LLVEDGGKNSFMAEDTQEAGIPIETVAPTEGEGFQDVKPLLRGAWAERLVNNQQLPVGGSSLGPELSKRLVLDFDSFEAEVRQFNQENIRRIFQENEQETINWLKEVGYDIDPHLFFLCNQVQRKVYKLLEVDSENGGNESERLKMYRDGKFPLLSSLKGKAACVERAALGQWLLQKLGAESVYVGGITMVDGHSLDEYPEEHGWIAVRDPQVEDSYLIFDIARPRTAHQDFVPRILRTEVPFNYDRLKGERSMLIKAGDVLQGGEPLYYGVGYPVAGRKNVIGATSQK